MILQIILRLYDTMFYQIFLSPQVKQCMISTYKYGIYELPHEFPNDLRCRWTGLCAHTRKKKDLGS